MALVPWLFAASCRLWRLRSCATLLATALFLVYVWTDYPINYASLGMVPYLLGIPAALLATATIGRYLDRPTPGRWLAMASLCSLAVMIHLTTAMIVVPAAIASYGRDLWRRRRLGWIDAGVIGVPVVVLLSNAFWWYPGLHLASTKGASDFAFAHPEPVLGRLAKIVGREPAIEVVLIPLAMAGLVTLARRDPTAAIAVGGFLAAGFGWGYLAGASRALDFLQPGRHTYAFYTAAALLGGVALSDGLSLFARKSRPLAALTGLIAILGLAWLLGPALRASVSYRTGSRDPFLSSRPTRRYQMIRRWFDRSLKIGDRLLYEEGGFGIPGVPDPFGGGRFSGLLPRREGVELLGGPYLHAALTTNFTQFGEDSLFGRKGWGREHFLKYARVYRPTAIACWSPHARKFCRENPDLVTIDEDDGAVMLGRVTGFSGYTVTGRATVTALPGLLSVRLHPTAVDDLVVLRYHSVPRLRCAPRGRIIPVYLEGDPVPFIGLRPSVEGSTVEITLRP